MNVSWTPSTAAAIGADWLLAEIAPVSVFGRRIRAAERAFGRGDEAPARATLARVDEFARASEPARVGEIRAVLAAAPDPAAALVRAKNGGTLDDVDFFEVSRFLEALGRLEHLTRDAARAVELGPRAVALRETLSAGRTAERAFYLADGFDGELASARVDSARHQATYDAARSRLGARVAAFAGLEHVRDGEFVLMREGLAAPLPPEIHVVREAPTYVLCTLALDDAALEALAARDAAATRVAEIEEVARGRLCAHVAAAASELERACERLGDLDVLAARAHFAQRFACVVPDVDAGEVAFSEARYLPLEAALQSRGRRYTPLSLELSGVAVITGPNMGGKTAALRTLGFVAACVALGLPVPAAAARIPLFDEVVWLGARNAAPVEGLLSAFGAEVVELRGFLERRASGALVLVDEFARTTSPREGRALLVALLRTLRERNMSGLVATHLTHIAGDAGVPHYASGVLGALAAGTEPLELDAALRGIGDAMDYRLALVDERAAPAADAIALAEALGLDRGLIARAKAAL